MKDLIDHLTETARAQNQVLADQARGFYNEPRPLNPETILGDKPVSQSANIIDLTRRYEIAIERTPIGWSAVDRVTYDPDPESALCITGHGKTTEEAVTDLLEQLAAVTVSEAFANRKPL